MQDIDEKNVANLHTFDKYEPPRAIRMDGFRVGDFCGAGDYPGYVNDCLSGYGASGCANGGGGH
jgi:hypothetical protein